MPLRSARRLGAAITVAGLLCGCSSPEDRFSQHVERAGELAADGVRSNAVDPGSMRTEMRAEAYPDEDPGQVPTPAEVADIFVWLASDRSAEVSGQRFRAKEFDAEASYQS